MEKSLLSFYYKLYIDAYQDHEDRIEAVEEMIGDIPSIIDPPNDRYSTPKNLGTWDNINTVDQFFNSFNHANAYNNGTIKLELGDYVTIQDGTYNTQWMIAGFDMEHNQIAADGTIYDNGYGICMIPKTNSITSIWASYTYGTKITYINSYVHTNTLSTLANKLEFVLNNHMIRRNVLLSSDLEQVTSDEYKTCDYEWTTSYATLMSIGQLSNDFGRHRTKYDDGEANYRLPLFINGRYNYGNFSNNWVRNIMYFGYGSGGVHPYYMPAFGYDKNSNNSLSIYPLIYLR